MQTFKRIRNVLLATSAMALLAACITDSGGSSLGGGGGGGGSTPSSVPELGLTGSGGTTEALGVAALTDPILGTDGVLGGGDSGEVGGLIPADQLAPLSSALEPVVTQVATALPLDTVTGQIPALGVDGTGGLLSDLTGQDPLTDVVGTTGVLGTTLGGGDTGALGNLVPAGTVPSLPTDSLPALPGLSGGDPLSTVTDAADTVTTLVTAATGGTSSGDPLAPVTGAVDTATSTLVGATGGTSSPLAPVTDVVDTVTGTLGTATGTLP